MLQWTRLDTGGSGVIWTALGLCAKEAFAKRRVEEFFDYYERLSGMSLLRPAGPTMTERYVVEFSDGRPRGVTVGDFGFCLEVFVSEPMTEWVGE